MLDTGCTSGLPSFCDTGCEPCTSLGRPRDRLVPGPRQAISTLLYDDATFAYNPLRSTPNIHTDHIVFGYSGRRRVDRAFNLIRVGQCVVSGVLYSNICTRLPLANHGAKVETDLVQRLVLSGFFDHLSFRQE